MLISKLSYKCLLAVRLNLGAKDENDTTFDNEIEKMSPLEITRCYCAWHLGYYAWADDIIGIYEECKNLRYKGRRTV